jgi:hypothetical protein
MRSVKIELDEKQYRMARHYADLHGCSVAESVVRVWWGRVTALRRYEGRKDNRRVRIRPHIPRRLALPQRMFVKSLLG